MKSLSVKKLSIVILKYVQNKNAYNSYRYSLFATDAKKRINVSEKACYVFICTKIFAKKNYHPIVSKDDITIVNNCKKSYKLLLSSFFPFAMTP